MSENTFYGGNCNRTFYRFGFLNHDFNWNFVKRKEGAIYVENVNKDGTGDIFQGERQCED